jgi:hypothetical protein
MRENFDGVSLRVILLVRASRSNNSDLVHDFSFSNLIDISIFINVQVFRKRLAVQHVGGRFSYV